MWGKMKNNIVRLKVIITGLLFCVSVSSQGKDGEFLIKSAFIEKITRFIEWPDNIDEQSEYIKIGVFCEDPTVFQTVQYYFSDQLVHNKKVEVTKVENLNNIKDLHVLFIVNNHNKFDEKAFSEQNSSSVLLITDNFKEGIRGAHINLITSKNKLNFEIDPDKLSKSGFYVSSKLYAYGTIIK